MSPRISSAGGEWDVTFGAGPKGDPTDPPVASSFHLPFVPAFQINSSSICRIPAKSPRGADANDVMITQQWDFKIIDTLLCIMTLIHTTPPTSFMLRHLVRIVVAFPLYNRLWITAVPLRSLAVLYHTLFSFFSAGHNACLAVCPWMMQDAMTSLH